MNADELREKIRDLELLCRLHEQYSLPVLDAMVQSIVGPVMRNPVTQDKVFAQEFEKGKAVGLENASGLPQTLLEETQAELRVLIKEIEDEPQAAV
jgi:hypothetical protein